MTGPQQPEFETPSRTGTLWPDRTSPSAATGGPARTVTVADEVAAAALAVPGVVSLHGGAFGEVGTYLPGRRVVGVRTGDSITEVHLVVASDVTVLAVAEQVRAAVAPLVDTSVDVYVEDLDHVVEHPRTAR